MKILWLGLNPSTKNVNPDVPFVGTRSNKRLSKWQSSLTDKFKVEHIVLNISKKVTAKSREIKTKDYLDVYALIATVKPDIIIGLGDKVGGRLRKLNVDHFQVPHPSPRNRYWNEKYKEEFTMKALEGFVDRRINE